MVPDGGLEISGFSGIVSYMLVSVVLVCHVLQETKK
jgi:tetrahydromethanopterin S-methyltransferase subunit F